MSFELSSRHRAVQQVLDMCMQIAGIAVLLQNENAGYTGPKVVDLSILEPYVAVGDQVEMVKLLQQLDLDEDFGKPVMVISNRDLLASKIAQGHAI